MKGFFSHITRSLILISVTLVVACQNGDSVTPNTRPADTIHGVAFDGLILEGLVSVYDFTDGVRAETPITTATTDNEGRYALTLAVSDRPLLIEVTAGESGRYVEEASGKSIPLRPDDVMRAVVNYTAGQMPEIPVTFYSNLAAGLATYNISQGVDVAIAIDGANEKMTGLLGFDILETVPHDITDYKNSAPVFNDSLQYGFFTAAVSQWTARASILNNHPGVHDVIYSMMFAQLAYEDIRYDGLLNGQGVDGVVAAGTIPLSSDVYRNEFALSMLALSKSDSNRTGATFNHVLGLSNRLNTATSDFFTGDTKALNADLPVVTLLSIDDGDTLTGLETIVVHASDRVGLASAEILIDGERKRYSENNPGNISFDLNTLEYANGEHSFKLMLTNIIEAVLEVNLTFNVSNNSTEISDVTPNNGSIQRGAFVMKAEVKDPIGIKRTTLYVDDVEYRRAVRDESPLFNILTLDDFKPIADGEHVFKIEVENNSGSVFSESYTYMIDNTLPELSISNIKDGDVLEDFVYIESSHIDNIGLKSVEILINGDVKARPEVADTSQWIFDTTVYPDSNNTISVRVVDLAGNSVSTSRQVIVNNIPLIISNLAPVNGSIVKGVTSLDAKVVDNMGIKTVTLLVNGEIYKTKNLFHDNKEIEIDEVFYTTGPNGVPDGEYKYQVVATDINDIEYKSDVVTFTVDNTDPSVEITSFVAGQIVNGLVYLESTQFDNHGLSHIEIYVNGELKATLDPSRDIQWAFDTTRYADSIVELEVVAYDLAGGISRTSQEVVLNNLPLRFSDFVPAPGAYVTGIYRLGVTLNDPMGIGSSTLTLHGNQESPSDHDGQTDVTTRTVLNAADYPDGVYSYYYEATDAFGVSYVSDVIEYTIDNTDPMVDFIDIDNGSRFEGDSAAINVSLNDNLGFDRADLVLEHGEFETPLITFTNTGNQQYIINSTKYDEGEYQLVIRGFDKAGNMSVQTRTVYMDQSAPTIELVYPLEGDLTQGTYKFKAKLTDPSGFKNVTVNLDGNLYTTPGIWEPVAETLFGSTLYPEGDHVLEWVVEDNAGRITRKTVNFVIDNEMPTATFSVVAKHTEYCEVTMADAGNRIVSIRRNNIPGSYDEGIVEMATTDGTYTFKHGVFNGGVGSCNTVQSITCDSSKDFSLHVELEDALGRITLVDKVIQGWVKKDFLGPRRSGCKFL